MNRQQQRRRLLWLAFLLCAAFCALGYRLVDIQALQYDHYRAQAERSHHKRIPLRARRGEIRDVRGEPLAQTLFVKTLYADPSLLGGGRHYAMAALLAPLLRTNEAALVELLRPRSITNHLGQARDVEYVILRRKLLFEDWQPIRAAIATNRFGLPAGRLTRRQRRELDTTRSAVQVHLLDETLRVYPNGRLASPVLGFVNADGDGLEGLEALFNDDLRGTDGWIESERDALGKELRGRRAEDVASADGRHVFLTIDAGLQLIVEEELGAALARHRAQGGCALAVQPRTGRILAMASLPSFDPEAPPLRAGDGVVRQNRCVASMLNPGSTFKIVAATAALNEGLFALDHPIHCENGSWTLRYVESGHPRKLTVNDDQGHRHGVLPLRQVIAHSSNIGTYKIARALGRERFERYVHTFGFDRRTGINVGVEEKGILAPATRWTELDFSRLAMGYSIEITPIQIAMAMAALANDGRLMRPLLIDHLEDPVTGRVVVRSQPEVVREVCRPEVARQMCEALKLVVVEGTGIRAQLDRFSVAGKTGTAQKRPYNSGRYYASFVGFFPADDPELCLAIIVDEPDRATGYYAAQVAAPVFKAIADRAASYLALEPDLPLPATPPDDVPAGARRLTNRR